MRHDKYNSSMVNVSRKVYEKSLICYPKDLRDDFGNEMIEVFDEQVSDAYSRSGFVGILRVWFSAPAKLSRSHYPAALPSARFQSSP